ncbi:protein PAXX isoform X2 [Choloepus didactylus]|uniref:protein PAXX isoform X2 n=1 Tax=Choloepus didactylus TaxID=27675 RepID=UPI0018A0FD6F|nr:protein PAXX isoform X2 [Choloepus didactylus]
MVPPPLVPPLCTLSAGPGPSRFVCYCEGEGGGDAAGFNLQVTDAAELWSTCFTPAGLAALKARFGLSAAEDITHRFRAACEQEAVTLTLQEDRVTLTLSGGPSALTFDLSKVPGPEAAPRLQALTLCLADSVCRLEQRLADPDPQRGHPGPGVRRRCPGESLINPGFKRSLLVAWTSRTPEAEQKARPTRNEPVRGGAAPGDPPPPVHPAPQARSQQINAPMGLDQALLWGKEVWDAPLGPGIWAGATGC